MGYKHVGTTSLYPGFYVGKSDHGLGVFAGVKTDSQLWNGRLKRPLAVGKYFGKIIYNGDVPVDDELELGGAYAVAYSGIDETGVYYRMVDAQENPECGAALVNSCLKKEDQALFLDSAVVGWGDDSTLTPENYYNELIRQGANACLEVDDDNVLYMIQIKAMKKGEEVKAYYAWGNHMETADPGRGDQSISNPQASSWSTFAPGEVVYLDVNRDMSNEFTSKAINGGGHARFAMYVP